MLSALQTGFFFSSSVILPIVLLFLFGWWLRGRGELPEHLVAGINHLVYRYALPALLFCSVINSQSALATQWRLVAAAYLAVLTLFMIATWLAKRFFQPAERGVFVQGVFRSNMAIIGLALIQRIYDEEIFAIAAICTGAVALLLSVLGVLCLSQQAAQQPSLRVLLKMMLRNPLIIALLLALGGKALALQPPAMLLRFGDYLAQLTLPLALLCAGASFDLRQLSASRMAFWASIAKSWFAPWFFLLWGWIFGLQGFYFGILFLLGAAPAANASYIMAKSIAGNDAVAAANIIALSNLFSLLSLTLGIACFQHWGWLGSASF